MKTYEGRFYHDAVLDVTLNWKDWKSESQFEMIKMILSAVLLECEKLKVYKSTAQEKERVEAAAALMDRAEKEADKNAQELIEDDEKESDEKEKKKKKKECAKSATPILSGNGKSSGGSH